ncbi:MAG: histidine--tRNA ligase [Firmicutes bacterium]|nr:histidine--tRNA ligase [Bacillota bacterium]
MEANTKKPIQGPGVTPGKFKPTNIKGAIDTTPQTQALRNRVTDVLRKNFEAYGYMPIETATLNYLEMLTYKYDSDAEIVREIYKIRDQGDRDLGLRFDLTVPFAKYIATNRNLRMPFRRYEIGKVYRNGPVKAGRLREFYQCDIDVVGARELGTEAEMIAMAVRVYRELGITPVVKYGNRKVLIGLIEGSGTKPADIDKVIGVIDRLEKDSRDEIQTQLCKYMKSDKAKALVESFEKMASPSANTASGGTPPHPDVTEFEKKLDEFGVREYCKFTPSLARGLNVYTSTVWEIYDKEQRITSSLGGGGRYDRIITDWISNGFEYPAVGMSFGLEPIMAILEQNAGIEKNLVDILIVPVGEFTAANKLADGIRAGGKNALLWQGDKVGKAMEYADKEKIQYVIVVGKREVETGTVKIKNMFNGTEEEQKI